MTTGLFDQAANPPNQRVHAFNFNFTMTTEQASQITANREVVAGKYEYSKQIHLRFGFYENSVQADNLPPNLLVNVNGKPAQLPVSFCWSWTRGT